MQSPGNHNIDHFARRKPHLGDSMNTYTLKVPVAGQVLTLAYTSGDAIEFDFDPTAATFTRDGGNLTLTHENGGRLVLPGFFEGDALPTVTLADGTTLDGGEFLSSMDPDLEITTAAGPSAAGQVSSSGIGSYADSAGSLIGGIDRLDSLDTNSWDTDGAEAPVPYAAGAPLPQAGGTTGGVSDAANDGGETEEPGGEQESPYIARAVLYQTADGAVDTVHFYLVDVDGRPVKGQGTELDGNRPSSANGLIDTDNISHHADGSFSFGLSDAGKASTAEALEAAGGDYSLVPNLFDYITFTYEGRTYTMQVVINANGSYNPADAEADRASSGDIYGEWHSETTGTGQGDRETGDGHDEIWLSGTGNALYGGILDTGAGDDAVHARGSIRSDAAGQENSVHLGEGDNSLDVNGHLWAQGGGANTVTAGSGTDVVDISGWVYAKEGGQNIIDTGTGESDGVFIGNRIYSQDAGSSNTIKTGGTLTANADVFAKGAANTLETGHGLSVKTAVEAWYDGKNSLKSGGDTTIGGRVYAVSAENSLESGGTLTVNGGVQAWYDTGKNTLQSGGDMVLNAESNALAAMNGGFSGADAGGSITINAGGAASGAVNGIYSYNAGSVVTLAAGEGISVTAAGGEGNSRATAVHAMNGGELHMMSENGDISLKASAAENQSAWGIHGTKKLSVDAVNGSVNIDVDGGREAVGIFGNADIHAKNEVNIRVGASSGTIEKENGAQGLHVHGQSVVSIDAAKIAVHAANTGGDAAAVYTYDKSSADISASGSVSLAAASGGDGHAYGMRIDRPNTGKDTSTTVTGNSVSVSADASGSTGDAFALHAKGVHYTINNTAEEKANQAYAATNEIRSTGEGETVFLTALGGSGSVTGMYAAGGDNPVSTDITAANKITSAGGVVIDVAGASSSSAKGIEAVRNAGNYVNAAGNVAVRADAWGDAAGIVSGERSALNSVVSGGDIGVTVGERVDSLSSAGLKAYNYGMNTLNAGGDIAVAAEAHLRHPDDGAVSMGLDASSKGRNTLKAAGNIDISSKIDAESGDVRGVFAGGGANTIVAGGAVTIAAAGGDTAVGLLASGGTNTVTGGLVAVSAVEGTSTSRGMAAQSGGVNLVQGHAGQGVVVAITAAAGTSEDALALWAEGGGSVNRIKGTSLAGTSDRAGTADEITLIGGIYAGNGGINLIETGSGDDTVSVSGDITGDGNRIETGAGNDVIVLSGAVQPGSLTLVAGDGYDTLVLSAPDAAAFSRYYESWLSDLSGRGLIDGMGIDAVSIRLDDADGVVADLGDMDWLGAYFPNLVQVETGAGNDVLSLGGTESLTVHMGDGDDRLSIDASSTGNILNGGGGNDTLQLTFTGGSDVTEQIEEFFGRNSLEGFETVLLDMSNGEQDVLNIDALLESMLPGEAGLFIRGDESDRIVSSGSWQADDTDVVTIGDISYMAWANSEQQTVYIEVGAGFMHC